jgi:hypothetical protein
MVTNHEIHRVYRAEQKPHTTRSWRLEVSGSWELFSARRSTFLRPLKLDQKRVAGDNTARSVARRNWQENSRIKATTGKEEALRSGSSIRGQCY